MILPGFHGRTEELAWLRSLWDGCTARDESTGHFSGGPRAAFVVAESGIGKSRLVQALYQQLTSDPAWDPSGANYWPDAFNDQGAQLRVVPDMSGHVSRGPPRFAWLGVRWQPTDVRNVSDRRSVLPELRHAIIAHAEILRRQGPAWKDATGRIRDALRKEALGEAVGQVADAAVPFGGLLMKLFKGAADLAKDRMDGPRSVEQVSDAAGKTLSDEVYECLHALIDGPGGLPTVLWLDDAQWIDQETMNFVQRVWQAAQQRNWPLMIVVTHWEREWRELARSGDAGSLLALSDMAGAEVSLLPPSPIESLDEYLGSRLPGLTDGQRALMLEKAAGNFLTMVENVGQLLRVPQNFVDRDTSRPLSAAGERKVREWESERQKRVEQRFSERAPELQDILGWGGHLGVSFLREVVEDFAERVGGQRGVQDRMREAVDPLVILGEPSQHVREFRDRAFHHVARRHFADYGAEHTEALDAVLRRRLAEWVNNSFDLDGRAIWPDSERGIAAPARSATGLRSEEARDVLGMALRSLPLPDRPDWFEATHVASLRARYLLVAFDRWELLWDRVRATCHELVSVEWQEVPAGVLSLQDLRWLANQTSTAGALSSALRMFQRLIDSARQAVSSGDIDSLRELGILLRKSGELDYELANLESARARFREVVAIRRSIAGDLESEWSLDDLEHGLRKLGDIERSLGNAGVARKAFSESLDISRRLAERAGDLEELESVSIGLERLGDVELDEGNHDAAQSMFAESLEIRRRRADELKTVDSFASLAIGLERVGKIARIRGELRESMAHFEESLAIHRQIAELDGTPEHVSRLCAALWHLGVTQQDIGDLDAALDSFSESLTTARWLADAVQTHESWRFVANSLGKVAQIEESRGQVDAAIAKRLEQLEVTRALAEELGTPQSISDLRRAMVSVADIEQSRGDVSVARKIYEEALVIARGLAEKRGVPDSWSEVGFMLFKLGDLQHELGEVDAALASHDEALVIHRQVARALGTPSSMLSLSQSLNRMAMIAQLRHNPELAVERFSEALEIRRELARTLGTTKSLRDVCVSLDGIAMIEQERGDLDAACAKFQEIERQMRSIAEGSDSVQSQRDLAISVSRLAKLEEMRGNIDASLRNRSEALAINRRLAETLDSEESLNWLIVALQECGEAEKARGGLSAALEHYGETMRFVQRVLARRDSAANVNTLVWLAQLAAEVEIAMGEHGRALARLEDLAPFADRLEVDQDSNRLDSAAAFFERRADALDGLVRPAEAAESRSRAAAIRARIRELAP